MSPGKYTFSSVKMGQKPVSVIAGKLPAGLPEASIMTPQEISVVTYAN
jgi:hypothetical protein